jgi:hypothetical protein
MEFKLRENAKKEPMGLQSCPTDPAHGFVVVYSGAKDPADFSAMFLSALARSEFIRSMGGIRRVVPPCPIPEDSWTQSMIWA